MTTVATALDHLLTEIGGGPADASDDAPAGETVEEASS
jgi:hypothetical protein